MTSAQQNSVYKSLSMPDTDVREQRKRDQQSYFLGAFLMSLALILTGLIATLFFRHYADMSAIAAANAADFIPPLVVDGPSVVVRDSEVAPPPPSSLVRYGNKVQGNYYDYHDPLFNEVPDIYLTNAEYDDGHNAEHVVLTNYGDHERLRGSISREEAAAATTATGKHGLDALKEEKDDVKVPGPITTTSATASLDHNDRLITTEKEETVYVHAFDSFYDEDFVFECTCYVVRAKFWRMKRFNHATRSPRKHHLAVPLVMCLMKDSMQIWRMRDAGWKRAISQHCDFQYDAPVQSVIDQIPLLY